MNFSNFIYRICFLAIFVFAFGKMNAQYSVSSIYNSSTGFWEISTSGLGDLDRVFYRFSDGYEVAAQQVSLNPTAKVVRKFQNSGVEVSAYIAKKLGTLGFASTQVPNATCLACPLPVITLASNQNIRLDSPSWNAFTDITAATGYTDNMTTPAFQTPYNIPWFILPVTIKSQNAGDYAEIVIPTGSSVLGFISRDDWNPVAVGSTLSLTSHPFITSVNNGGSLFKVFLTGAATEFKTYLIISTDPATPPPYNLYAFNAKVKNSSNSQIGITDYKRIPTSVNPHDPNHFTAFEPSVCAFKPMYQELNYRVDFQNTGQGIAEQVVVNIKIDPNIFEIPNLSSLALQSSHTANAVVNGHTIAFTFPEINLPGLNHSKPINPESTQGWVEFKLFTQQCLPIVPNKFISQAAITFHNFTNNFTEITPTNPVEQFVKICASGGTSAEACNANGIITQNGGDRSLFQEVFEDGSGKVFIAKCYPSLFNDLLTLEIQNINENGQLQMFISDLTGKKYAESNFTLTKGEDFITTINASDLPRGIYFIHLKQGSQLEIRKVIKI